ncbi:MAG TPA: FtsX-like permease family protein [Microvirga sp.]|jgi:putative ABC transport system permease protein|nr:FtsX-like permease family protein [Microvirga sp.]
MSPRLLRFALLLGWRQAARRARRSLATFAGVTGGLVLVLMQLGFQDALYESAVRIHRALAGEVVIVPREFNALPNAAWFERGALAAAEAHPDVAAVATLNVMSLMLRNFETRQIQALLLLAIDPEVPAIDPSIIGADLSALRLPGRALWDTRSRPRWGDISGTLARDGTVEVETALAGLHLQVPLTIAGSYSLGGSIVSLGTMLVAEATLTAINGQTGERPTLAVLRLQPGTNPTKAARAIGALLPPYLLALTRDELAAREKRFWSRDTPIGFLFDLGALLGFVICAVFVGQALVQTVEESLPEYAVLRTLDLPDRFFVLAILVSGVLLAAAATPVAGVLAALLYRMSVMATGLPLEMSMQRVALVGLLAAVTASVAGLAAGRRIRRADPASLL